MLIYHHKTKVTLNIIGCIIALALLGCTVPIRGPKQPITPTNGPPAQAFIVPDDVIPTNWTRIKCESQLCKNDSNTYEEVFTPPDQQPGQFRQEVFRFNSVQEASSKFSIYKSSDFHRTETDPNGTDFLPPRELPYISSIADEFYFACGQEFGLVCRAIARYENYFVYFYFDVDNGQGYGVSFTDIDKILKWLDSRASQLVNP